MRWFSDTFGRLPDEIPNRLSAVTDAPSPKQARATVLVLLVIACLIPRAWAALRQDILCHDGAYYLDLAKSFQQGDWDRAFDYLGLNTYPAILILLQRAGLDLVSAGRIWGVVAASLTVLPLFGWLRRAYHDQAALVGCVLYAMHPRMIHDSPLILRDQTAWLLFVLSLYLGWRAVTEIRWPLFVATGLAMALATHTRDETWVLPLILIGWTCLRFTVAKGRRRRLLLGMLATFAIIPSGVLVVNLTVVPDQAGWQIGRMAHLRELSDISKRLSFGPTPPDIHNNLPHRPPSLQPPVSRLAANVLAKCVRMLSYAYGLLALIALVGMRRIVFRRDQLPLWLGVMLLLSGIFLRLIRAEIDARYFFPVVLLAFPCISLGLLTAVDKTTRLTARWFVPTSQTRARCVATWLVLTVGISTVDLLMAPRSLPHDHAHMGKWILRHTGPQQTIVGNKKILYLVRYYAQARKIHHVESEHTARIPLIPLIIKKRPSIILLWNDIRNPHALSVYESLLSQHQQLGYRRIDSTQLPLACRQITVLIRVDLHTRYLTTSEAKSP